MRKLLFLSLVLALNTSSVLAHSGHEEHGGGKDAAVEFVSLGTVDGTVTLLAKSKGFPSTYTGLYKGRDPGVNVTPAGKVIKVSGSYNDGDTVTVNEKGSHDASYSFILPVIRSVVATLANSKEKGRDGLLEAVFEGIVVSSNSTDSVIDNTGGGDDDTETSVRIVRNMSVSKFTAVRKGNKAIVTGSFLETGTSARGRFKLTFTE
jgi:hypothetical protein